MISRRTASLGLGSALALQGLPAWAKTKGQIIIIGGGFGGASCASMLRRAAPKLSVTLIEPNPVYTACPMSNLVLAGARDIAQQAFGYDGLRAQGVKIVHQSAKDVDALTRRVTLSDGQSLTYDRLVLSSGIAMRWGAIEGYDQAAAEAMPHSWKAGRQTIRLRDQIRAMDNGGTVVISVPPPPYRCPPGPYERASLIAHYLKQAKPRSKILILDSQDNFSKQALFEDLWATEYAGMIERIPAEESGQVIRVDPARMEVLTDFDMFKADVANIIPPQRAGLIAQRAQATNSSGWCPVDAVTFESSQTENIHVIGDAIIAAPMPKSAFAANLQGKVCALQIARLMAGQPPLTTTLTNTCYSYGSTTDAFSITGVYSTDNGFNSVPGAGGTSALMGDRKAEAAQARDWFARVTKEAFG